MVKHELKKITHYEYWEFWVFYIPMIPVWLYHSLKAKSLTYFTATNPGIEHGGFFEYSKFKIQEQIAEKSRPVHQLITSENNSLDLGFNYPFIAKPEKGQRGISVQIINSDREWEIYKRNAKGNIIVQEYIDLPKEYGVFYAKLPYESKGKILSITGKEFLTYQGDGTTSLREFIESNSRAYFNKSYLYMKFHEEQNLILPAGEKMILERIGNHHRGTYFYDNSSLITPALEAAIENIASNVEGFYYGRLDVKAKSDEAFRKGEFIVLEINGANSEATHIYDEEYSIIDAYKEVVRHLDVQYKIAKHNIKNGAKTTPIGEFSNIVFKHL
ncbi:hypothetical protein GO491_09540 [Flavobacteriaceae bacterium Ap0902]|nr:hypothetical protein [Flavobacteriaceae bacterium Ap0902]